MNALTLTLTLLCLLLGSCSKNPAENPDAHETPFEILDVAAESCVLDTRTQLIWQRHTQEPGLHSAENTYSWFDPDEAVGELDYRGVENGGACRGSRCDTWHYVQAVNLAGYCGHNDWRMPSKDELFSISELRRAATPPTINTDFFPLTHTAEYWSGNDYSFQYDTAWAWNFEFGHDRVDWKKEAKFVRLVRGTAGTLEAVKE